MKKQVFWIEGDGIGPEIWQAVRPVLDAALARTGAEELEWTELLAGEKGSGAYGRTSAKDNTGRTCRSGSRHQGSAGNARRRGIPQSERDTASDPRPVCLYPARALV